MKPPVSTLNPNAASYVPLAKRQATEAVDFKKQRENEERERRQGGFYGSSSSRNNEETVNEEFDVLEFLQMSFPGVSDESLNHVYVANKCDLEATVDILSQLEFDSFESPESLPDFLDIEDVSDLGTLAEHSSVKLKNVVGEASAPMSGSSVSETVTVT